MASPISPNIDSFITISISTCSGMLIPKSRLKSSCGINPRSSAANRSSSICFFVLSLPLNPSLFLGKPLWKSVNGGIKSGSLTLANISVNSVGIPEILVSGSNPSSSLPNGVWSSGFLPALIIKLSIIPWISNPALTSGWLAILSNAFSIRFNTSGNLKFNAASIAFIGISILSNIVKIGVKTSSTLCKDSFSSKPRLSTKAIIASSAFFISWPISLINCHKAFHASGIPKIIEFTKSSIAITELSTSVVIFCQKPLNILNIADPVKSSTNIFHASPIPLIESEKLAKSFSIISSAGVKSPVWRIAIAPSILLSRLFAATPVLSSSFATPSKDSLYLSAKKIKAKNAPIATASGNKAIIHALAAANAALLAAALNTPHPKICAFICTPKAIKDFLRPKTAFLLSIPIERLPALSCNNHTLNLRLSKLTWLVKRTYALVTNVADVPSAIDLVINFSCRNIKAKKNPKIGNTTVIADNARNKPDIAFANNWTTGFIVASTPPIVLIIGINTLAAATISLPIVLPNSLKTLIISPSANASFKASLTCDIAGNNPLVNATFNSVIWFLNIPKTASGWVFWKSTATWKLPLISSNCCAAAALTSFEASA